MPVRLPVLALPLKEQRYSCHGCGDCCRDFTVQLRDEDLARLHEQGWEAALGEPVTIEFRGRTFLRQRPDGGCIFLLEDGRCRIHAEHGFAAKPVACQLFPFHLVPGPHGLAAGINFACQSVRENRGADLASHRAELRRMTEALPELDRPAPPVDLADDRPAEPGEVDALVRGLDAWMTADEPLARRLDGLAWIAQSLVAARLRIVRGERFAELVDVLVGALPEELDHLPVDPPTGAQRRLLRQAVFTRTEDPRLPEIERRGRWRITWDQLRRHRRFRRGRGPAPRIGVGWPEDVPMDRVETVRGGAGGPDAGAVDDLVSRYVRASLLGGRSWGPGYYGWPVTRGLVALLVGVAAVGWLARLHAAGRGLDAVDLEAVRAAIGRIDRTAGRAPWLGGAPERLRARFLAQDDGVRRILAAYPAA